MDKVRHLNNRRGRIQWCRNLTYKNHKISTR